MCAQRRMSDWLKILRIVCCSLDVRPAKLEGFEIVTVPRADATRIELPIARTSTTTVVVGSMLSPESPVAPLLGNTLTLCMANC